jgi:tetratricopeptide (TPR) repeat protein
MEAITYLARALGAARNGDPKMANQALEKLTLLHKKAERNSTYWAIQIEIHRLSVMAWIKYQEGRKFEALDVMKKAAELESTTEKHPATPGEILPARELSADMLLDMGRYWEAQTEYEKALLRSSNRSNSLYGAGLAAELGNNKSQAVLYYKKIVEITEIVKSDWEQLKLAKKFLSKNDLLS